MAGSCSKGPDAIRTWSWPDVPLDTRRCPYVAVGDLGAGACLAFAVAMAGVGGWR